MNIPINIIITDDHPLFRMGIKSLLSKHSEFKFIGEAENGEIAIELIKISQPDIIILDIDMPVLNGIQVGEYIKKNNLEIRIIFLTSHTNLQSFNRAKSLNFMGFIFKESALEELIDCLKKVMEGEQYISPLCQSFIDENSAGINKINKFHQRINTLTPTEKKILKLIANHYTTKSIAEKLFNSYKTIENHRFNICQKLEISGANNLLTYALEHKEFIDTLDI